MKKILILLLVGVLFLGAFTGCSVKSKASSFIGEYADNPYYAESVKKLKTYAGLDDQQADDAFGVFVACGIVTDNINYVFTTTDPNCYTVWFKLAQYDVTFDADKAVQKIVDASGAAIYENGTVITTDAAETTEQPATEQLTEKAPEKTEAAPAETENPIVFTNYTNYVEAGSNATVTIQGTPNTEYKIHVYYDSGESTAQGLEAKTSDANGMVTWEWKVGSKTTTGTHAITVEGGGAKNSVQFDVFEQL